MAETYPPLGVRRQSSAAGPRVMTPALDATYAKPAGRGLGKRFGTGLASPHNLSPCTLGQDQINC